jgi:hypothetical protein
LFKKGSSVKISRASAIERLKNDCMSKDETLYISSCTKERESYGEYYVTDFQFSTVLQKGSLEDVMRGRNILKPDEEVLKEG